MNCIIKAKLPIQSTLTDKQMIELLIENKDADYSYQCLLNEVLRYNPTIETLLCGWGEVKLFKIN